MAQVASFHELAMAQVAALALQASCGHTVCNCRHMLMGHVLAVLLCHDIDKTVRGEFYSCKR